MKRIIPSKGNEDYLDYNVWWFFTEATRPKERIMLISISCRSTFWPSLSFFHLWNSLPSEKTLNFCFKKLESNQQPAYLSRKNTSELELKYYKKAFLDKFLLWFKALDGYPKIWNCQKIVQFFNLLIVTPPLLLSSYTKFFYAVESKTRFLSPRDVRHTRKKRRLNSVTFAQQFFNY